jgi:plastocyanin
VTNPRRIAVIAAAALAIPATALAAGTRTVSVKDDAFKSKSITVSKGTRIKWVWHGTSLHNVTVTKGPVKFRSSTKTSGSYSRTLSKKGTYRILCTVHAPSMKMTVTVR